MPYRRLPNTTPSVLRTLKTAHDTYLNTPVAADRAIGAELFAQLDLTLAPLSLYARFVKESSEVDIAQAAQAPLTSAAAHEAARLTIYASHFHQVLDLGIVRGDFATGARSYYGRDVTATALPDLSTYEAVAAAADKIGTGEAARQLAEGAAFTAMALPSAAEVTTHFTAFTTARNLAQQAQVKTDREREDVTALYPAAQALAVDLCDTIEFYYRKDPDDASRRAKCKRWGVVYFYEPNEPQDSEPTPAPAPAIG
jgi:hypothetical protein